MVSTDLKGLIRPMAAINITLKPLKTFIRPYPPLSVLIRPYPPLSVFSPEQKYFLIFFGKDVQ